jgi:hypothetical protein
MSQTVRAHLRYLSYVLRHKWFVFLAGLKTGAPLWRLIVHDWSKFLPAEWFPYVAYFNGSPPDLNPVYYNPEWREWAREDWKQRTARAFDRAWLHHQHANPHHWQHWLLREDDGGLKRLPMPEHFIREMVADWMGAGQAQGKPDVAAWYRQNAGRMVLHADTRARVEALLAEVAPHEAAGAAKEAA